MGLVGAAALVVLVVGFGLALAESQAHARRELEARFDARVELTARFAGRYVDEVFEREQRVALARLASPTVAPDDFDIACDALGFEAAVLLDSHGGVLAVRPAKPALLGVDLTPKYPHLAAGVAGHRAVSGVTPSAATGTSIVAFALPFESATGRRVFSGGADVQRSPLGAYIAESIPIPDRDVLVVDSAGAIAASVGSSFPIGSPRALPAFLRSAKGTPTGSAQVNGRRTHYRSVSVSSTPLTVVGMAPLAAITRPVDGSATWLPWVVLMVAAALATGVLVLFVRLVETRASLTRANAELDATSRHDRLTGLYNRRHLEDELARAADASRRSGEPLAVLMIDADHFKLVNDRLGHATGDAALAGIASRLAALVRGEDTLGRWGGEEFLVVLPHTTVRRARVHAERLRAAIADAPILAGDNELRATISVGCAAAVPDSVEPLLEAADAALYEAKAEGRNRVASAEASVRCPSCELLQPVALLVLRLEGDVRAIECPQCKADIPIELLEAVTK